MELNGRQRQALREALSSTFNLHGLELLVSDNFNEQLGNIVLDGNLAHRAQEIILWADRRGWVFELIAAAQLRRPRNVPLAELAQEIGLASTGSRLVQPAIVSLTAVSKQDGTWVKPEDIDESLRAPAGKPLHISLERVVQERGSWINIGQFVQKLSERQQQICRVVLPGSSGTGFLVGPDLVFTNHHVIKPLLDNKVSVQDVHCLFDYRELSDGTTLLDGRRVKLHAEWLIHKSPPSPSDEVVGGPDPGPDQCDYALLRLEEEVGNEPAGVQTADADAEARGWIPVADPPPPAAAGHEVFVFQHPKTEPLRLSIGRILGFNNAGNRLRHDANTRSGSSGSPCVNADLELIALHHAGDPDYDPDHRPEYNQAIPFLSILASLKKDVTVPAFWESS